LFSVDLSEDCRVLADGTSDGTQDKYFFEDYWYKKDRYGGEGEAEYLAAMIMRNSNLPAESYAIYEKGNINGYAGCRSRNFLNRGENLITLSRLHRRSIGSEIGSALVACTPEERAEYTVEFVRKYTGLDLSEYLANTFFLDLLILNEDRHFNNLSVVFSAKNGYRIAPIFDNGKALLVGNYSVNDRMSVQEKVRRVIAKPFSGSHMKNYELFSDKCSIRINKDKLLEELKECEASLQKDILLYNIENLDKDVKEQIFR